jgi:hypothetical protein
MSNPLHRLRPLPVAPLVVRRKCLIEVPCPLPAAPLVVTRLMLWPLRRCALRELNRGAQAHRAVRAQVSTVKKGWHSGKIKRVVSWAAAWAAGKGVNEDTRAAGLKGETTTGGARTAGGMVGDETGPVVEGEGA